jgi:hypothetical protein
MNEIVIKKSELLTMKYGLGKSNDDIALKYNISKKEAIDALETFGLIKKRTGATTAKYTIRLMDDIAENTKVAEVEETPEVRPENDYTFNA